MLVSDMWTTLANFIISQVAIIEPNPIVYIDIAPIDAIQNLARGGPALIGIFDRNMSRNTTRWNVFSLAPVFQTPQTAPVVSGSNLYAGLSQTIMLTAPPIMPTPTAPAVGDAVSAVISSGINTYSAIAIAEEAATYSTLATLLAANINAQVPLNQFIYASADGPVVTVLNIGSIGQQLTSFVGSAGSQITEWAREVHSVQVDLLCQTYPQRAQIGSLLLGQFAKCQATFGLQQPDGTWMNIRLNNNMPSRDTHNNDIYRWIFLLDIEIGLTTQDAVYLAIQPGIIKNVYY